MSLLLPQTSPAWDQPGTVPAGGEDTWDQPDPKHWVIISRIGKDGCEIALWAEHVELLNAVVNN